MKKLLSLITIFALTLSFSTNLYVSANDKTSENVTSVSEVQNNKNKNLYLGVAIATLVAVTSTIATARIAYIRGVKNGKADYWLSDENIKATPYSAWNWISENVPYAASSAWNWISENVPYAATAWDWTSYAGSLAWNKTKSGTSSAWDWTSENVPYAASLAWDKTKSGASSAWDWTKDHTYCKMFNCEESSAE